MQHLKEIAAIALDEMKALGASAGSAEATLSERNEFNIDGGQFSLFRTTRDKGLSLKAIKDQRQGAVSGNSHDSTEVASLAQACVASAQAAQQDAVWDEALARQGQGDFVDGLPEGDMDRLFMRTQEMLQQIKDEYPRINLEQATALHTKTHYAYQNTYGVTYSGVFGAYAVSLMFSGNEEGKSSSFNGSDFVTIDLDRPFLSQSDLRQALSDAQNQIHTIQPEGKFEGSVIFTPSCLGSMLYELIGNYLGGGVILDGTSQWKDKLDQQVVDKRVTLSFDPFDPRIVTSERYTALGFPSQGYDLIRDGVVKQFKLSNYTALKTGHKRAPNDGFALVMKAGDTPLAELIKNTKKGLLVSRYSGGASSADGEFSGVAKNSFLIEDGKIGPAVSETMISGNLGDMLNHIAGISREVVMDGSSVLPWLAVEGVIISGK